MLFLDAVPLPGAEWGLLGVVVVFIMGALGWVVRALVGLLVESNQAAREGHKRYVELQATQQTAAMDQQSRTMEDQSHAMHQLVETMLAIANGQERLAKGIDRIIEGQHTVTAAIIGSLKEQR